MNKDLANKIADQLDANAELILQMRDELLYMQAVTRKLKNALVHAAGLAYIIGWFTAKLY